MILPTDIEPADREAALGGAPNGIGAPRMEPHGGPCRAGERWLAVAGSKDAQWQSPGPVRRLAKGDAGNDSAKAPGPDSGGEVGRVSRAPEVDGLCRFAHRATGRDVAQSAGGAVSDDGHAGIIFGNGLAPARDPGCDARAFGSGSGRPLAAAAASIGATRHRWAVSFTNPERCDDYEAKTTGS